MFITVKCTPISWTKLYNYKNIQTTLFLLYCFVNVLDCCAELGAYASASEASGTALTFTSLRFGPEHVPRGAGAAVAPRRVAAQAVVTEQPVYQALIDVWKQPSEDRRNTCWNIQHSDQRRFVFIFCHPSPWHSLFVAIEHSLISNKIYSVLFKWKILMLVATFKMFWSPWGVCWSLEKTHYWFVLHLLVVLWWYYMRYILSTDETD